MADEFFYKTSQNEPEQGPIDSKTLKKLARSGGIWPESLLRRGSGDWVVASSVKGLFPEAPSAEVPEAIPVSPPAATPSATETGGVQFPSVAPTKPAPEVPSGLDSLVVGGKKSSSRSSKESASETKKPAPLATPVAGKSSPSDAPPAASIPGTESNPFASDSKASSRPNRRSRGGIGSLFNFDVMIAPTVIKVLFFLAVILTFLAWLGMSVISFGSAILGGGGIFDLIGAAILSVVGLLVAFMYVIVYRVSAEIVITFFQINENVRDMRELMEDKSGVID